MRKILKVLAVVLAGFLAMLLISFFALQAIAGGKIRKKYPIPQISAITLPTDSASLERGRHLATAVSNCVECHGSDLGGNVFMDAGPLGLVAGPNLTRGQGGIGSTFTDTDWIRAIRYGIRADSTSLMIMPSETFAHFSEADLGALIAYVKQVPPVDREIPRSELRALGKVLLAAGILPVMVAEHTQRVTTAQAPVPAGRTPEYGRYLADISGCRGCHGPTLAGTTGMGPPDAPQPPNLTPAGPLGQYSDDDFIRAMREGKRPNGDSISTFMPWMTYRNMTDDELHTLLLYLRSVPPVAIEKKG